MKLDLITNKAEITDIINPNYAIKPLFKYLKSNSKILYPFDTENSLFVKLFKEEGHIINFSLIHS
jgi:hypothetical protein